MTYSLAGDYVAQQASRTWDVAVPAALTVVGAYIGARMMPDEPMLGATAGAAAGGAIYLKMDRMLHDITDMFEADRE